MTRVALVTGATRGLGRAVADALHDAGYAVARNGRSGDFPADVTDGAAVAGLVEDVTRRLGPIDVLVVNATGPQPGIAVEDLTWQDHLDQLEFFVKSPTLLVQAVLPTMKERGGRIVMMGSDVVGRAPYQACPHTSPRRRRNSR